MLPTHHSILAAPILCALVLPTLSVTAKGQTTPPVDPKLALTAVLVLTPEFCATKVTKGGGVWSAKETFELGKAACAELEPVLKGVFSSLTRVAAAPAPEEKAKKEVILLPKFVDASATRPETFFSSKEMLVLLEWTVKDASGKTVWIETVEGDAKSHKLTGTHNSFLKKFVADVVQNAADNSAGKMSSSPELRKLAQ